MLRHYSGVSESSSDHLIASLNSTQSNPWQRVDGLFTQRDTVSILYAHFIDREHYDTLIFHYSDSAWHWTGAPNWKAPAMIKQSDDSLIVAFGWGYGGESFYLKEDQK
jgi:hypothetical protein